MALNRVFAYVRSLIGIKGADGSTIASNSNPVPVSDAGGSITVDGTVGLSAGTNTIGYVLPPDRAEIASLTFDYTGSAANITTWVDVRQWKWLDFDVEVQTSHAFTALLEFTDAVNPNTTPPGANDIVRSLNQTIAGTALSGLPTNVLSFGVPAQMRWVRLTATPSTGSQTIKVTTYGQVVPPTGAQLPLGGTITTDFRAPIVQSMEKGHDPAGVFRARRFSGLVSTQSSTTTITAGNNFTGSEWTDTTGFVGVSIFLKSAADTTANGVELQTSFDNGTTTHFQDYRTYDVAPDGTFFKFSVITPGAKVRVKVTAGASDMTSLVLKTYLLADETEDVSLPLDAVASDDMVADLVKANPIFKQDNGNWVNQVATNSGNPKIAIEESIRLRIEALNSWNTNQSSIGTTAVQVNSSPSGYRGCVAFKAHPSNTGIIYIGNSSSVTTGNGYPLAGGESVEIDIDEVADDVYAIADAASQVLAWLNVRET